MPEAFSVLGFAFYMQPMLMPVLKEMPGGPAGVLVSERAVHVVLFAVACGAYGTVGIFGASIYGAETESNIMVNDILTDPHATLALYAALIIYLCCGMVTTHYALRASVDVLLCGPDAPFTWVRQVTGCTHQSRWQVSGHRPYCSTCWGELKLSLPKLGPLQAKYAPSSVTC